MQVDVQVERTQEPAGVKGSLSDADDQIAGLRTRFAGVTNALTAVTDGDDDLAPADLDAGDSECSSACDSR